MMRLHLSPGHRKSERRFRLACAPRCDPFIGQKALGVQSSRDTSARPQRQRWRKDVPPLSIRDPTSVIGRRQLRDGNSDTYSLIIDVNDAS